MPHYYVVVNKHRVQANRKNKTDDPVFRISHGVHGRPKYAHRVNFPAGATLVEDRIDPLPCGATVWVEAPSIVYDL